MITEIKDTNLIAVEGKADVVSSNFSEKIIIGHSDYSRKQIEIGSGWSWGVTYKYFLETIKEFEAAGYTVKFKTSLLRRIFAIGIYKIVAYK